MAGPKLPVLPDKGLVGDDAYNAAVVENVIGAYKLFLSDSMALDYCGIADKQRAIILGNKEYKRRTRIIRAEKFLEEIDEIELLSKSLGDVKFEEQDYDMRDKKQKQQFDRDYKDLFGMKLKAAEMRRELLNMGKREDAAEETAALNIFFVPLTQAEFLSMKNAEVYDGEELAEGALDDGKNKDNNQATKIATNILAELNENEIEGGYLINKDGTAEDF